MSLKKLQRIAVFVFFFSINFEVWDPLNTGYFSIAKFTGLIYFATLLPEIQYFVRSKGIKQFLNPLWLFFGFLTTVNFLNINVISSEVFNFSIFQNIILLVLLYNHSRKEHGILEKAMVAYAIGSAVFALLFFLNIGVEESVGGRIRMFGDNENVIGVRICISLVYLLFLIIRDPLHFKRRRFLLFIPVPIMFSLLLATGSRLAFLSFASCFIAGVLLMKTKKVYIKFVVLLISAIIGIIIWSDILSSALVYKRLLNTLQSDDLSGRSDIWKSIIPLIKHNPIFGVGTTGYDLYCYKTFGSFISPHNVILEILCYTGLFGFVAYFYFFARVIRFSYKKYEYSGDFIYLLLIIPIFGSILSGQILLAKIGWVLYAFILGKGSFFVPKKLHSNMGDKPKQLVGLRATEVVYPRESSKDIIS